MNVVVLGAGVLGVTTAFYLAQDGHQVTVIDRSTKAGQDATGGNAGLLAPGHCFPWGNPQAPAVLLRSLRGEQTALRMRLRLDPQLAWWGAQFLRECTSRRARQNTLDQLRLCQYSRDELDQLTAAEGLEYQQHRGALYLHRTEVALQAGDAAMRLLRDHGEQAQVLDPDEIARLDPGLAAIAPSLAGAIHVPADGAGNSQLFTELLVDRCHARGVEFQLGITATGFTLDRRRVRSVSTDAGPITADTYVLALGVNSPALARTAGQRLPIYPAKGYSLTVPIKSGALPPSYPGVDDKTLLAWSRMDDHLRMSSTVEFAGHDRSWTPRDFANIIAAGDELFPGAADWDRARKRACLRPATPDGPPIIGRGKLDNLFYNTGHGHLGWTMACGSSRIVADLISNRRPAIALDGYAVRAYRH